MYYLNSLHNGMCAVSTDAPNPTNPQPTSPRLPTSPDPRHDVPLRAEVFISHKLDPSGNNNFNSRSTKSPITSPNAEAYHIEKRENPWRFAPKWEKCRGGQAYPQMALMR